MKKKWGLIALLGLIALALTACGCGHQNTVLKDARAPECGVEGYSGDLWCADCNQMIQKGDVLPALGHRPGEQRTGVRTATCTEDGYTGDITCTRCGAVVESGEVIPAAGHVPEDARRYAEKASCFKDGYSGNLYCGVCGEMIEAGKTVPATGHHFSPPADVPVCPCLGFRGEMTCDYCGTVSDKWEIPYQDHVFVGNTCSVCGWMKPGYYQNGEMVMSWEEMKESNLVDSYGKITANFSGGTLVLGEDIDHFSMYGLGGVDVEEIWIPRTVSTLPSLVLFGNESVKSLVIYARDRYIDEDFVNCNGDDWDKYGLDRVVLKFPTEEIQADWLGGDSPFGPVKLVELPEGLREIGKGAFRYYRGSTVKLPSTVRFIRESAFYGSALESIEFPEGLISIGSGAFAGSNITSVTFPSTIEAIDRSSFNECSLETVDMSGCVSLKEASCIGEDTKEFLMPPNIVTFYEVFQNTDVTRIVFPETMETWKCWWSDSRIVSPLKEIVWPVRLTHIEDRVLESLTNLETICYRGTELQWSMNPASSAIGANVTVVCNWTGE